MAMDVYMTPSALLIPKSNDKLCASLIKILLMGEVGKSVSGSDTRNKPAPCGAHTTR